MKKITKEITPKPYTEITYKLTDEDFSYKSPMLDDMLICHLNGILEKWVTIVVLDEKRIIHKNNCSETMYDLIKSGYKIVKFELLADVFLIDKVKEAK